MLPVIDLRGSGRDPAGLLPRAPAEAVEAELDRYGVERVPADVYLWGGYRYSNARDALAAAKRKAAS